MDITKEEEQQLRKWINEAEDRASILENEWLIGLYTGEAMGYKVMLHLAEMEGK